MARIGVVEGGLQNLEIDDLDFGDIPEIEGVEIPPFVCKIGKNKEAAREALAIDIYKRFSIREEERPVIETIAYCDKYKKILDGICIDKMKLDGEMKKEEEEAIIKINLNALADTGSDINVMPYRVYKELGREELKNVNNEFTMMNQSNANYEAYEGYLCPGSDDEEDYGIQRNSFGAPMYGPKPAKYLNCRDLLDRSIALQEVLNPFRKICVWKKFVSFLGSLPVALQHEDWKPEYTRNHSKKEEGERKWYVEIRLTDPLWKCV
ncbi:hypothetical protein Tco_1400429 [Tanacetum coccineum]